MLDFARIRNELLRNGVSKKLLWSEYMEKCRQSGGDPLMYSQFCHYIRQDEQDSYRIDITSIDPANDRSMREVYGMPKALSE